MGFLDFPDLSKRIFAAVRPENTSVTVMAMISKTGHVFSVTAEVALNQTHTYKIVDR